jgi:hypothetical protein
MKYLMYKAPLDSEASPAAIEDVLSRLVTTNSVVLSLVYAEALRQLDFEHKVREKIERKAQVALGLGGLSTLLAMVLVMTLATLDPKIMTVGRHLWTSPPVIASVLLVLFASGVSTAVLALIGLKLSNRARQVDYREVLAKEALKDEETWYRWMTPHIFSVAEAQGAVNRLRSVWVRLSLLTFTAFLAVVTMLSVLLLLNLV